MADWGFLGSLLGSLQARSPLLGRLWLLLLLLFRMLILGTVASDMFSDEQDEFSCNTLQPGCKQVCYDHAFPISQYRFWVFHIVLISTPALVFLMYAMHHHGEGRALPQDSASSGAAANRVKQRLRLKQLYVVNVGFRLLTELCFLIGQCRLYGFRIEAQFPCSRFPCPHTVDCFTSRPMEKTVFLLFYFAIGVLSALASVAELIHVSWKWDVARVGDEGSGGSNDTEMLGCQREQRFPLPTVPNPGSRERRERGRAKVVLSSLGRRGGSSRRSNGRRVKKKTCVRVCSFRPRTSSRTCLNSTSLIV